MRKRPVFFDCQYFTQMNIMIALHVHKDEVLLCLKSICGTWKIMLNWIGDFGRRWEEKSRKIRL
jgi:hypothetical protein